MSRLTRASAAAFLIVIIHLALGIAYGVVNPIFESPDELSHFSFVRHLATGRGLPIQSEEAGRTESHQPPLYYLVGAVATFWINTDDFSGFQRRNPFWGEDIGFVGRDNKNQYVHTEREDMPYRATVLAVHVLRLLSTAFGAITVVLTYLLASQVFPSNRAVALGSAVLVAFNPQFIFINSSVSNDSLVTTLSTAALYLLIKWPSARPDGIRRGLMLGVLIAAAILIKLTAVLLILVVAIAVVLWTLRDGSVYPALKLGAVSALSALAVSGWWFVRNLLLYQEWSGMDTMERIWGTNRLGPFDAGRFFDAIPSVWRSYWGTFGWGNVPLDGYLYQALLVLVCAAGGGLVLGSIRLLKRERLYRVGRRAFAPRDLGQAAYGMVLLVSWLVLVIGSLAIYIQTAAYSEFGRFLFPSVSSIAILIFLGLSQLLPARRLGLAAGIGGGAMFGLSLAALVIYLAPAYSRPVGLDENQLGLLPNHVAIDFGNRAEIVAYELRSTSVDPGQTLEIDLYWRAIRKMREDYAVFIHLFAVGDNSRIAQRDTYPGGGTFSTSAWTPGEIFRDTYRVKIPPSFQGPALLRIDVGLYSLDSKARLPLASGDRGLGQNAATLGTIRIPAKVEKVAENISTTFEDSVVLAGDDFGGGDSELRRGQPLTVKLFWKAEGKVQGDYTVFVHLVDDHGQPVAQHDGKPVNGNYPTWAWSKNEIVPDTHSLRVPIDVPPGRYQLVAGLYDPTSMQRLTVLSADRAAEGSAVVLGSVWIR